MMRSSTAFLEGSSEEPRFTNSKLGLNATETETLPDLRSAEFVAAGGEAEVFEIRGSKRDKVALKVYFPSEENPGNLSEKVFALSDPAMTVATTARLASNIYSPQKILDVLNNNQLELEKLDLGDPAAYTLERLRQRYVDFRGLNHRGVVSRLVRMHEEKGEKVPDDLYRMHIRGGSFVPPKDYRGGLTGYLNGVTGFLSKKYPQLELPDRLFPEVGTFGVISSSDNAPDKFSNRFFLTMEWVPDSLESLAIRGYESVGKQRMISSEEESGSRTELLGRFLSYLENHAPLGKLKEVHRMLKILEGYDLAFGDLRPENIGIQGEEIVFLDPGTMVIKGAIQDFASEDYLPQGAHTVEGVRRNPTEEFEQARLRAHPWFDKVALDLIMRELVTNGVTAAAESIRFTEDDRRREHVKNRTSRALQIFGVK